LPISEKTTKVSWGPQRRQTGLQAGKPGIPVAIGCQRQRRTSSKTGFTGVYKEHNRYRAVISIDGKSIHIGMFDSPEEAAAAYNKLSKDVYGEEGKINKVKGWERG
jgi:hypothetical protein